MNIFLLFLRYHRISLANASEFLYIRIVYLQWLLVWMLFTNDSMNVNTSHTKHAY